MEEVSYSSLVRKYDNFLVPAMVMKLGGVNIKLLNIKVSRISVQLSIDSVCSASFTLEDVYDVVSSSLNSVVKNVLKLGSTVSIELGYGSSTKAVFWGYVHELSYSYSEAPSIAVTALDVRRLMMMNKVNRTFTEKSYADIFKEVMSKYSKIYKSTKVDIITGKEEQVVQTVSDYDFVLNEICKKTNKEFYVLAGDVYLQAKGKNPLPLITLTWGESLLQLDLNRKYRNEEIVIYSVDEKSILAEKEKVKSKGSFTSATTSPIRKEILNHDIKNKNSASIVAEAEAAKSEAEDQTGSGSCIGLPDMVPGRYINIAKLGVDGSSPMKVFIKSIKHSFSASGFTTDFTIGG